MLCRFGDDAERLLEGQCVNDHAALGFGVDTVAQVHDPGAQVTAENVTDSHHRVVAYRVEVDKLDAFAIEKLVETVPQMHVISDHLARPLERRERVGLSAAERLIVRLGDTSA